MTSPELSTLTTTRIGGPAGSLIRAGSQQEIIDAGSRSFWGEPFESWRAGNLVGTPEQVHEKIRAYEALGLGGIVAWCSDYPETESLRLLGEKVLPELR